MLPIRSSVVVGVALCCVACSSWDQPAPGHAFVSATANPAQLLGALTAQQVVDALPKQGLSVVNPVDSTAAECPSSGCEQAIVTDRFRILSFPSTAKAEGFAADAGARQIETLAVVFSPNVPAAEQDRYWAAIVNLAR